MTDAAQATAWIAWFLFGLAACATLARSGVASTYVRDVLHVGAGTWVLGWPYWRSPAVPTYLAGSCAIALATVPLLAGRSRALGRVRDSVTGADERWIGLVFYGISFAALTWRGLREAPFPAAGALLALSLGDGIGGALGRRFGRHAFRVRGGKTKSFEGSAAVAVFSALGIVLAAAWFGTAENIPGLLVASAAASITEAIAPRATDNLFLPLSVYCVLLRLG